MNLSEWYRKGPAVYTFRMNQRTFPVRRRNGLILVDYKLMEMSHQYFDIFGNVYLI